MIQFRDYITEDISAETIEETKFLVDAVYTRYIDKHNKNQPECVGWLDGTENGQLRFQKVYEAGIGDKDSILDVGCGVAHLHIYLKNQGWHGKYLGIDPNKKAIDLIDENINTMCGTVEDLDDTKYDWVIASGIFNLGLKEEHSFWIIENMISHANKGIIFNMLRAPWGDGEVVEGEINKFIATATVHDDVMISYEAYNPLCIKRKLSKFDHGKIEIIEDYMKHNEEFTVYFYV